MRPYALLLAGLVAAGSVEAQTDLQRLQGDWTMVSATLDGTAYPGASGTRHVSGDTTTVTVNGQLLMRARFILRPATNPKAIDYQILEGATAGSNHLGIYQVGDSTLTFCLASPGAARPTEFASTAGDGRTCSEWKRKP